MNKSTFTIEPTEFFKYWLAEKEYFDPQYVPGQGWFAFKRGDVVPRYIQNELTLYDLNRQCVHPLVDLLD